MAPKRSRCQQCRKLIPKGRQSQHLQQCSSQRQSKPKKSTRASRRNAPSMRVDIPTSTGGLVRDISRSPRMNNTDYSVLPMDHEKLVPVSATVSIVPAIETGKVIPHDFRSISLQHDTFDQMMQDSPVSCAATQILKAQDQIYGLVSEYSPVLEATLSDLESSMPVIFQDIAAYDDHVVRHDGTSYASEQLSQNWQSMPAGRSEDPPSILAESIRDTFKHAPELVRQELSVDSRMQSSTANFALLHDLLTQNLSSFDSRLLQTSSDLSQTTTRLDATFASLSASIANLDGQTQRLSERDRDYATFASLDVTELRCAQRLDEMQRKSTDADDILEQKLASFAESLQSCEARCEIFPHEIHSIYSSMTQHKEETLQQTREIVACEVKKLQSSAAVASEISRQEVRNMINEEIEKARILIWQANDDNWSILKEWVASEVGRIGWSEAQKHETALAAAREMVDALAVECTGVKSDFQKLQMTERRAQKDWLGIQDDVRTIRRLQHQLQDSAEQKMQTIDTQLEYFRAALSRMPKVAAFMKHAASKIRALEDAVALQSPGHATRVAR